MKRLRAHLEALDQNGPSKRISSDWNGGTYPYIQFPVPHSFSIWIEYLDIDYQTGDIFLTGVKERTMKSGVRYNLDGFRYHYNGYIDYEMYDDVLPYSEDTLEIHIHEDDFDFRPGSNEGKGRKDYVLPYKEGVEITTEILGYDIKVIKLRNEEVDISINNEINKVIKLETKTKYEHRNAVCLGKTEDQVYEFGDSLVLQLIRK